VSKWKPKDRVVVTSADGPVETMGDVYGIWAVTARLRLDGTFCTNLFVITHVPTGYVVQFWMTFATVKEARRIARALNKRYPAFHVDGGFVSKEEAREMIAFINLLLATDKVAP